MKIVLWVTADMPRSGELVKGVTLRLVDKGVLCSVMVLESSESWNREKISGARGP